MVQMEMLLGTAAMQQQLSTTQLVLQYSANTCNSCFRRTPVCPRSCGCAYSSPVRVHEQCGCLRLSPEAEPARCGGRAIRMPLRWHYPID